MSAQKKVEWKICDVVTCVIVTYIVHHPHSHRFQFESDNISHRTNREMKSVKDLEIWHKDCHWCVINIKIEKQLWISKIAFASMTLISSKWMNEWYRNFRSLIDWQIKENLFHWKKKMLWKSIIFFPLIWYVNPIEKTPLFLFVTYAHLSALDFIIRSALMQTGCYLISILEWFFSWKHAIHRKAFAMKGMPNKYKDHHALYSKYIKWLFTSTEVHLN